MKLICNENFEMWRNGKAERHFSAQRNGSGGWSAVPTSRISELKSQPQHTYPQGIKIVKLKKCRWTWLTGLSQGPRGGGIPTG